MADPRPEAPAPTSTPRRPLRRRRDGRIIAGVAAGVADHLGIDTVIVRILFVVTAIFTNGLGLIAYVLGWIFIPKAEADEAPEPAVSSTRRGGRDPLFWVGIGLLIVGAVWLVDGPFGPMRWFPNLLEPGLVWPLVLIVFGLALWHSSDRAASEPSPTRHAPPAPAGPTRSGHVRVMPESPTPPPPAPTPHPTTAPSAPAPSTESDVSFDDTTATRPLAPEMDQTAPTATLPPPGGAAPPPPVGDEPAWTPPPVPSRRRSLLGRITIGLAFVTAGVLWLLRVADVAPISVTHVAAASLLVIGLGLLVGSVAGRARWLIIVGVLLAPLVLATELVRPLEFGDLPSSLHGPYGEVVVVPATTDELDASYEIGVGRLILDLTRLELTDDVTVDVRVGAGQVLVRVPDDVSIDASARVGAGEIVLFGSTTSGLGVERDFSAAGDAEVAVVDAGSLTLDVEVGLGQVDVTDNPVLTRSGRTSDTFGLDPTGSVTPRY